MNAITEFNLYSQRAWSDRTFGLGKRLKGVLAHIRKELVEVEAEPTDASEWADLLILVIDGATRQGITGGALIRAYHEKMLVNRTRQWPDWREYDEDEPIEHIRDDYAVDGPAAFRAHRDVAHDPVVMSGGAVAAPEEVERP